MGDSSSQGCPLAPRPYCMRCGHTVGNRYSDRKKQSANWRTGYRKSDQK
jgi:hypothetical protein